MLDHPLYRRDPIAPASLVLELLLANGEGAMPVGHLLAAGALFDISDNHIRVTLTRLTTSQMVETPKRGYYQLGPASRTLAADVARWRDAASRLRAWNGAWVLAYAPTGLPNDKPTQQRHARALHLLGFAPWGQGLHIRPDNLEPDLEALRERLHAVGLHPATSLFCASHFTDPEHNAILGLWNGPALNRGYVASSEQLQNWMKSASRLPLPHAARESLVLGGAAIRQLIFDPLLPAPLIDVPARQRFMEAAIAYDVHGRTIWQAFFASLQSRPTPFPFQETSP